MIVDEKKIIYNKFWLTKTKTKGNDKSGDDCTLIDWKRVR
jgi:hypothetical protein